MRKSMDSKAFFLGEWCSEQKRGTTTFKVSDAKSDKQEIVNQPNIYRIGKEIKCQRSDMILLQYVHFFGRILQKEKDI
jgi:hypothetical protein